MLGLFRRTHNQVSSRGSAVLAVEHLETRDQPSVAPTIVNFSDNEIGNGLFSINGQVIDQNPEGLVVTFGGVQSANGLTAVTKPDGTFSVMVQLQSNGADGGYLTATTLDAQGWVSTPVALYLEPTPATTVTSAPVANTPISNTPVANAPTANTGPTIVNFSKEEIVNGLFLISGQVVDQNPGGLVVTFGGSTTATGTTVTTTPDGTFSCTIQLPVNGTGAGFLTATTVDAQGLVSAEVFVFLDPTPVVPQTP